MRVLCMLRRLLKWIKEGAIVAEPLGFFSVAQVLQVDEVPLSKTIGIRRLIRS